MYLKCTIMHLHVLESHYHAFTCIFRFQDLEDAEVQKDFVYEKLTQNIGDLKSKS